MARADRTDLVSPSAPAKSETVRTPVSQMGCIKTWCDSVEPGVAAKNCIVVVILPVVTLRSRVSNFPSTFPVDPQRRVPDVPAGVKTWDALSLEEYAPHIT
ncbi:hypothetical protein BaRGS_00032428 [Batillaria attramentaria]|uniref:Uncharacterized protein n=1 Tax=Batillaria attramentaria TaxID=370345 RepID=A0ABD0JNT1_9CAEN